MAQMGRNERMAERIAATPVCCAGGAVSGRVLQVFGGERFTFGDG